MDKPSKEVLKSARFISSSARHVSVDENAVEQLATKLLPHFGSEDVSANESKPALEPDFTTPEQVLQWIFLLDVLNFCFWSEEETLFTYSFRGVQWTGYRSMCAALTKAVEVDGIPICSPSYYRNVTLDQLKSIFKSETDVELPLLHRRLENLHEAAEVLAKEFDGQVSELVRRSNQSAQNLVELLVKHFSSFRDIAAYRGRTVYFLKRAQIFVADVWDRFRGQGYGEFHDIDTLTMFADYRVPQCLVYLGVLKYSKDLEKSLEARELLKAGDEREVEIRGCSIWAVELLKQKICNLMKRDQNGSHQNECYQVGEVNAAMIDFYLWDYAKSNSDAMKQLPIHRTYTVFY